MDVKIENGDTVLDMTGMPVYTQGFEEILQQVMICITSRKGKFIYNKDMGCSAVTDVSGEREIRRLEARLREAIASVKGAQIYVDNAWELVDGRVRAEITIVYGKHQVSREVII